MHHRIVYTLFIAVCVHASYAFAHSQPLPVVSNKIIIDEGKISCLVTIPSFMIKALDDIDSDTPAAQLVKYHDTLAGIIDGACPVEVDGIRVKPVVDSIRMFLPPPSTPPPGVEPLSGPWKEIYVQYKYGLKHKPDRIRMEWNLYPQDAAIKSGTVDCEIDDLNEVVVTTKIFGTERFVSFVPEEPEYIWYSNEARGEIAEIDSLSCQCSYLLPVVLVASFMFIVTVLCVKFNVRYRLAICIIVPAVVLVQIPWFVRGSGIAEAEAERVFTALHTNVYRAFDYKTESDIYDALARSVSGKMLKKIYKDVYHGNILQDEGAMCQIHHVEIVESDLLPGAADDGFRMSCVWRVTGLVEHWGHVHRRKNEYQATYTVKTVDGKWKIVDVVTGEHRRITRQKSQGS